MVKTDVQSVDTLHLEKSASVGLTKADMKGFKTHQNFLNYKKNILLVLSLVSKNFNLALLYQIKFPPSKIAFMKAIKPKPKIDPRLSRSSCLSNFLVSRGFHVLIEAKLELNSWNKRMFILIRDPLISGVKIVRFG